MNILNYLALVGALFYPTPAIATTTSPTKPVELTIEEKILNTFNDPIMVNVARCESQIRQFDKDGKVLIGVVDNDDKGVFQINKRYWLEAANKLGYNIYETDGNIKMAKHIYDQQGIGAWKASKGCWGKK